MTVGVGMIVLNSMPWLTYSVRAVVPYADEIVIVEGIVPMGDPYLPRKDGVFSQDGTAEEVDRLATAHPSVIGIAGGRFSHRAGLLNWCLSSATQSFDYWIQVSPTDILYGDVWGAIKVLGDSHEIDCLRLPVRAFTRRRKVIPGIPPAPTIWKLKPGARFCAHKPMAMSYSERVRTVKSGLALYRYSTLRSGTHGDRYAGKHPPIIEQAAAAGEIDL